MNAFSLPINAKLTGTASDNDDVAGVLRCKDTSIKVDKGLTLSQRLRKSNDFDDAFKEKRSFVGKYIVLLQRHGDNASLRVGVISSKRTLRRAVDRNRAKRLMREAFRLNRHLFSGDVDVVLIARRPLAKASLDVVERDLMRLARKAGMLS